MVYDLFLKIEQRPKGDIEEVAASTSRIEDSHFGQPLAEGVQRGTCPFGFAVIAENVSAIAGIVPLTAQRLHHNRLHDKHDVVRACVVRPQLRALGGVQSAFEQRAEYRRFYVAPVLVCRFHKLEQRDFAEFHCVEFIEQVAVELGNLVLPEKAAVLHSLEKSVNDLIESLRASEMLPGNIGE